MTTTAKPSPGAAVRGGTVAMIGQVTKVVLQIAGLVLLGRLIGPAEFGMVAMVMAVLGVAEVFRDFGLSSAAIQADVLTRGQRNNLFWISTGLGLAFMLAGFAASFGIATFYHDDRLVSVAAVLSSTFALNGLQAQFTAELARQLRFSALAATDLAAAFIALVAALLAALWGLGHWALVIQIVVQAFVGLALRATLAHWLPGWPSRRDSVRGLVRYGWNLMLTQTLIYLSSNLDKVLIGNRFGAATLGVYTRAMQIVVLPATQLFGPVTNVALPILSRLRSRPDEFGSQVLNAQRALGYPVVACLGAAVAVADPFLVLLMGEPWGPVVPLFRLLAAAALFQVVNYVIYWVFLALGQTGSHFRYSLVSRSILILGVVVGAATGVEGVAVGYLIGTVAAWPLALWWVWRLGFAQAPLLFRNGCWIIMAGAVIGGAGLMVSTAVREADSIARLAASLITVLVTGAALMLIPRYRKDVHSIILSTGHLRLRR